MVAAKKPRSLKEALSGVLPAELLQDVVRGFDIIGDIAVIEIPRGFEKYEKKIGQAVLSVHRNVKTVCKKAGKHVTEFRVMPVEVIAGEARKPLETVYQEHGVRMRVRVGEVYFSPRLGTERQRIAGLVREGEVIAALFAGAGPFPLVIARQKKCEVYAVELNPVGVDLMQMNVQMNRLKGRIIPLLADARDAPRLLPPCDRVLMPMPKGGEDFLDVAFRLVKPGGTVHFYQFAPDSDLWTDAQARVWDAARRAGKRVEIASKHVVRPHAPRVSQVVIDFRVFEARA
jgi:tRNA (guanine37-N1)-methyltransferase